MLLSHGISPWGNSMDPLKSPPLGYGLSSTCFGGFQEHSKGKIEKRNNFSEDWTLA